MLVSHDWLCDWVAPGLGIKRLAERLTLGGLEVTAVTAAGPALQRVVVGEILRRMPHPNSPALAICEVDAGRRAPLRIVCGAANAIAGCKAPLAGLGAQLPGAGGKISAKTIGGVTSQGMLCSGKELGLEEHSDGLMLLDAGASCGQALGEHLGLSDRILEIELTPNRGDCLGVLGLAREIAALTGAKWKERRVRCVRAECDARLPVELRAPRGCPRYAGRALCGIDMRARTPDWMAERLRRGGLRRLNIVVDITNYVMLELGQPMHAFDLDKLARGIIVREARRGETLRLLDAREITLEDGDLVIADHDKAVALAGVMGGHDSAISDATRNVYFEAAFFPASAILGRARRFGLHTDAAHRFERGVDPGMQAQAIERATRLLRTLAGGEAGPVTDARAPQWMPRAAGIAFDCDEIARLLGIQVRPARARALLERLGMRITPARGKKWKVRAPGWRSDLAGAHDLVEEIGRVHGFDQVPPRAPRGAARGGHSETRIAPGGVKQKLVELGYFEAITYSFVDPRAQEMLLGEAGLALRNPLADNLSVMRRSLWPGLLEAVKTNLNRRHERVRLFETGAVFLPRDNGNDAGDAREVHLVAAAASGAALPVQWGSAARAMDFFDIKGDLEALLAMAAPPGIAFRAARHVALHPGRCAQLMRGRDCIGHLGQLHPRHQRALDLEQPVYLFELELAALARARLPRFAAVSRYPAVRRDLAVETGLDVAAQDVLNLARDAAGELLVELELFDIYQGARLEKGKKSFAFRLTFQSESRNLTAEEADAQTENILRVLQRKLGARLRA